MGIYCLFGLSLMLNRRDFANSHWSIDLILKLSSSFCSEVWAFFDRLVIELSPKVAPCPTPNNGWIKNWTNDEFEQPNISL